jgi:ribose transport system substrate-binding protein
MSRVSGIAAWVVIAVACVAGCDRDSSKPNKDAPASGAATGGPGPATAAAPKSPVTPPKHVGTIGLSVLTMTNPFFKEIADTMADEAAKSGFDVIVTSGENDASKQYAQVKDFISKKVAAIVLTPCDSRAVGAAVREANDAGIPVFTADIACVDEGAKVVAHVATDNYAGGREAAKAMMRGLNNKGKVAIIDHPAIESVTQRTKGFNDELAEAKSRIQVVATVPGKGLKDESFKAAQDVLTANKDLVGIFAINDPSALGAVAAIEKAGRAGRILVVGFDGQIEGKQAIKAGKIYADPIQFPDQIGRQTVQTIVKYLEGEKPKPSVLIPTKLYFQADAEKDPALK